MKWSGVDDYYVSAFMVVTAVAAVVGGHLGSGLCAVFVSFVAGLTVSARSYRPVVDDVLATCLEWRRLHGEANARSERWEAVAGKWEGMYMSLLEEQAGEAHGSHSE
jgi:hypothetical protein